MTLLAMDIGLHLAWTFGYVDDLVSFRVDLPAPLKIGKGYECGKFAAAFADQMLTIVGDVQPTAIYTESSFRHLDLRSALIVPFMTLRLEEIAQRRRVPCTLVNVQTVRAWFCRGIPRITDAGEKVKEDARVNLACVKRGCMLSDEHKRDSFALWQYAHAHRKAVAA